ncbi:MAG: HAMP domain-containing histidine kinase, partial [Bacteroidales bacterium]|nr:HAMP domain-containing histidine kinase [Bacteroidales bacterium]
KLSVKSKQTADYSIIFNQLEILVNLTDEKQIIQVGFDLLNSLYAPSHIVFTRLLNKHNERFEFNGIYNNQPQKSENCFEIKVYHSNKVLGIFEINGIQFPQYLSEYKKTGVLLSYLLGLAIANARKYEITIEQKKQLEAFSLELQKTNNSKDKFFSILAHDLSSPFHSLLGMSEFLNTEIEKGNIEKVKKFSDTIYQTITKTYNLLTNLLDWAQSQTGKIQFKPELFFLSEIVDEIILLLNAQAENKTITLNNLIHADLSVYADKNMLSTVIRNLVSNAIKYSNKNGIITISASGNEHIRQISVSDNGIGISLENIEKLFQIEKVISRPGTHEETGTGLGLILCKEFIEKHDGEIWVESDIGKGSIFHFTLPVKNSK